MSQKPGCRKLCALLMVAGSAMAGAQSAVSFGANSAAGAATNQAVAMSLDDAIRRGLETSQALKLAHHP